MKKAHRNNGLVGKDELTQLAIMRQGLENQWVACKKCTHKKNGITPCEKHRKAWEDWEILSIQRYEITNAFFIEDNNEIINYGNEYYGFTNKRQYRYSGIIEIETGGKLYAEPWRTYR